MLQRAVIAATNLCLALSATESNYFVGEIDLAGLIQQVNAFPIGICSLTGASFASLSFGVYTCEGTEQVIFEDYGADVTCSSTPLSTTTYALNDSLSEGDLYSFNCGGEDNYQVAQTCTTPSVDDPPEDGGMGVCCQPEGGNVLALLEGGCLPYTTATGVCQAANVTVDVVVQGTNVSVPIYSRIECDGMDSYVESYLTSDCSDEPYTRIDAAAIDECTFFNSLGLDPKSPPDADIYRLMSSCVADSAEVTNGTYCTAAPTMEPTDGPTDEPTLEPTMTPTEDDDDTTDSTFAVCSTMAVFSAIASTLAVFF